MPGKSPERASLSTQGSRPFVGFLRGDPGATVRATGARAVLPAHGRLRSWAGTLLFLVVAAACGQSELVQTAPQPTPQAPEPNARNGKLDVAVLVGATARWPSDAEVSRVLGRARQKLREKTGVELRLTEIVEGLPGEVNPNRSVPVYLRAVADNPPEAVAVLSADPVARSKGGWAFPVYQQPPFVNEFPSPVADFGSRVVYGAALDFDHVYAACGYDEHGNHVSDVNLRDCGAPPGTVPCVQMPHGWVCANSLRDPYADADYFHACTVLHEILHSFGHAGNLDHFGAGRPAGYTGPPPCSERVAATRVLATDVLQDNCAMCPDLWGAVRRVPSPD